jgi:hypothetical protein
MTTRAHDVRYAAPPSAAAHRAASIISNHPDEQDVF